MAWESGGGFFKNLGNMFSGIGQGGGGFMGDFGTGEGAMSKWQPFQNLAEGRGFFGKEGGFGSGEGQLSEMFKQQDVTGGAGDSLINPFSNELNLPPGADVGDIVQSIGPGGAQPEYSAYEPPIHTVPSNFSGHQPPIESTGVTASTEAAGPDDFLATQAANQLNPVTQAYGDAGGAKSVLAGTQQEPFIPAEAGPVVHEYKGPWSNEFYDEHGTELEYGPQTEEWHKEHRKDPSNPWYSRGPMQKMWDKFGRKEGLMNLMQGLAANEAAKGGSSQPQYTPQDPLRFYGGSGSSRGWADVTGGSQPMQYNPLSQGLAGYYNPELRDLR